MNQQIQGRLSELLQRSYREQFWVLQIAGWAGLSIVSYFSLNLWYDQPDLAYVGHNVVQSLLGIALSTPLRYIYRRVWDYPAVTRGITISLAVLLFATAWACLRLIAFEAMTGETGLWSEFGGWLFPSIFIFLCWTAFYHGMKYYRLAEEEHTALLAMQSARNSEAAKAARAESSAREAQLKMLRYQLNPHFLFNTLNAIQSLVASRQTERANAMISALSDFLRYSLYTETHRLVTVEEEFRAVQRYLEIEQARFRDRLRVETQITEEARGELMPNMLLQPLVENAIKYGVAPCEEGGVISISAFCDGTHLNLEVTDTGCGSAVVTPISGPGVGLQNIRQRLENTYGPDHHFALQRQDNGGMCAEIRIPLFVEVAFA
jgi:signal transduction histidine kinase